MRLVVLLTFCGASLGLAACGEANQVRLAGRVVTSAQWKAVLQDWYDGRISDRHTCGAVVVASSHLPVDGPIYSTLSADLIRYASRVCTHEPDLTRVKVGMTDADVAAVAGAPQLPATGRCWDYWQKSPSHKGLAVCFRNGRVVSRGAVYHWLSLAGFSSGSTRSGTRRRRVEVRIQVTSYRGTVRHVQAFTLTCKPTGGTLPLPGRVCRDIAVHPRAMLNPPKAGPQMTRSVCGGSPWMPQVAVKGTQVIAMSQSGDGPPQLWD